MKKLFVVLLILLMCTAIILGCAPAAAPAKPATQTPGALIPAAPAPAAPAPAPAAPAPTAPAPTTAKPAAPTGPIYGGWLRWIEPNGPATAIGIPWETGFGHPSQQICEDAWIMYYADGSFGPWMAEFTPNPDPKAPNITWKFRKGIKFHDGTDLNAQVVKWGWDKIVASGLYASVRYHTGCNIIDNYTVETPLKEWRNSQYFAFSASEKYMVSPTNIEKKGLDACRFNICSTGPFKQVEFIRDVQLKAVRFDDYWQTGKPYLEGCTYLFVADEMTRLALFKTGGAEVMNLAGNGRIAQQLQNEGWNIVPQASGADVLLPDSANTDSPWASLKVRQAAEYALDKASISKAFGFGFTAPANQVPSPAAPSYIKDLAARNYDPAKAKALLAEAGFPNGFKTKIIAQTTANRDVVVAVQSQYKTVGIDCDLDFVEPLKYLEYQTKGWKNGLLFLNFGMEGNPIPSIGFNFPPVRTGRYLNVKNPPGWEEVYNKSATTPTVENAWLQKYSSEIFNDAFCIPIQWTNALYAVSKNVRDLGLGKFGIGVWDKANTWMTK